ncbi:MAG: hypothetical protein WA990_05280 [Rubrobacteraceae bacterium]
MQLARDIFRQGKYFSLSAVIIVIGVIVFLSLLAGLGFFSGGLNCDSYATGRLVEWFSFVAERCG